MISIDLRATSKIGQGSDRPQQPPATAPVLQLFWDRRVGIV